MKLLHKSLLLLSVSVVIATAKTGESRAETGWQDPPFTDSGQSPDVTYDGIETLTIKENLESTHVLEINCISPDPVTFSSNSFTQLFGFNATTKDDHWMLTMEQAPDYDGRATNLGSMTVTCPGSTSTEFLVVQLANADDNPPVITAPDCSIPEDAAIGEQFCEFEVSDVDRCAHLTTFTSKNAAFDFVPSNPSTDTYPDCLEIPNTSTSTVAIQLKQLLDFEKMSTYFVAVDMKDAGGNTDSATIMVKVTDVADQPPVWQNFESNINIKELETKEWTYNATDGDFAIKDDINIHHELEAELTDEQKSYFEFSTTNNDMKITIKNIDRDKYGKSNYEITLTACEVIDTASCTEPSIINVNVEDVNNKAPVVCYEGDCVTKEFPISIDEHTTGSIEFNVTDPDLNENGRSTITVSDDSGGDFSSAFMVIPDQVYQTGVVTLSVRNPTVLDFEDQKYQNFVIKLTATEAMDSSHTDTITINVGLKNVNDNSPTFENLDILEVNIKENEGSGTTVTTLVAEDEDNKFDASFDTIKYYLSGTSQECEINSDTGVVTLKYDDALDYERQKIVSVPVYAEDAVGHQTFATLQITVDDVNDTPPQIRVTGGQLILEEDTEVDTVVTSGNIISTDVDSKAVLDVIIDWDQTTAKKQGQEVTKDKFQDSFIINTDRNTPKDEGEWISDLTLNKKLSWTDVDTILLNIVVTDTTTDDGYINSTSVVYTINIQDVDDNEPTFVDDTCTIIRTVKENSAPDTLIGNILAIDIDGPPNNVIEYKIRPADRTKENLVKINKDNGQLYTDTAEIDADCEDCNKLTLTVTAYSPANDLMSSECNITITVEDENDNSPTGLAVPEAISINEDVMNGTVLSLITGDDIDTSVPFSSIQLFIDINKYPDLEDYFDVVNFYNNTAQLIVSYGTGFDQIDCDDGKPKKYDVIVSLMDNYNQSKNNRLGEVKITVNIDDVNDNAPEFVPPPGDECFINVAEDLPKGSRLSDTQVKATDIDSGQNSQIDYTIVNVTGDITTTNLCNVDRVDNLFQLGSTDGYFVAKESLSGCVGEFIVLVRAEDQGVDKQFNEDEFKICVTDVNDHSPVFVFPIEDFSIRELNGNLVLSDGSPIPLVQVTDDDVGDNGAAGLSITNDASEYFQLFSQGVNSARLQLKDSVAFDDLPLTVQLDIRATDKGIEPRQTSTSVTVFKVNDTPIPPKFNVTDFFDELQENSTIEKTTIPKAFDENNFNRPPGETPEPIYYYLFDGDYSPFEFKDNTVNELSLKTKLDATVQNNYTFRVCVSNADTACLSAVDDSFLNVLITVEDINDKPPKFTSQNVTVGMTQQSNQQEILRLTATDPDAGAVLQYYMIPESFETSSPDLDKYKDGFIVDANTGGITVNFKVDADLTGNMLFDVRVDDEAGVNIPGHMDVCAVKVYLITERTQREFVFENSINFVRDNSEIIVEKFSATFEYECVIDYIVPTSDSSGKPMSNQTTVTMHFMDTDEQAVDGAVIDTTVNDYVKMNELVNDLSKDGFVLTGFVDSKTEQKDDKSTLVTIMIAVAAVLGVLFLTTAVVSIIRTRRLSKRVKAFSTQKFDQPDIDKSNDIFTVPNTNLHAVVGSNPVWNEVIEDREYDNVSEASSADTDLIGIENEPEFRELENPQFVDFYNQLVSDNNTFNVTETEKEDATLF